MKHVFLNAGAVLALASAAPAMAHDVYADDHAPIGVMGDHAHNAGEIMFSARVMHMEMDGVQIGTEQVDPDTIVTTIPNRFAGMAGQPPTLRVVPTEMTGRMVMVGAMYAPIDEVTFAVMGSYISREMDTIIYQGGMGTNVLAQGGSKVKGFGDLKAVALVPLLGVPAGTQDDRDEMTLKAGISIPTGSITQTAQVLTPMGTTANMRAAYGMQPGSGTWDLVPALTYKMRRGKAGFGVQASGVVRLGHNDENYALGDIYEGTAWASYRLAQGVSLSARARARTTGQIDGLSPAIMGPVQGANPDFSGGERVDLFAGANFVVTHGALAGHRLGVELGLPVYQDLNGPQTAADWSLMIGWQKAY